MASVTPAELQQPGVGSTCSPRTASQPQVPESKLGSRLPRTVCDEQVEAVITATLEPAPPGGDTYWSTRSMVHSTDMCQSAVSRIWQAVSFKPVLDDLAGYIIISNLW